MSDTRQIRKTVKQLQMIKTWQLAIVIFLLLFLVASFLRLNNVGMIQRREAVYAADRTGDPNEIRARIYDLQRYAASHMNADTGDFYLQEQYSRDSKVAIDAASRASSASATINAEAEAVCHPQFHGYSSAYMQCFMNELAKHPASSGLPEVSLPNPTLYKYNFSSPLWSPDFGGWSLVFAVVLLILIVFRLAGIVFLRLLLKRQYREV